MSKLHLNLDEIAVESFDVAAAAGQPGTVYGHYSEGGDCTAATVGCAFCNGTAECTNNPLEVACLSNGGAGCPFTEDGNYTCVGSTCTYQGETCQLC